MELHTELLVSRWHRLAPATEVLERATFRSTPGGSLLLADDVDSLVHLVAHAQLQEETYTLLGLPLRALHETARHHLSAPTGSSAPRFRPAAPHGARGSITRLAEAGVAAPPLAAGWTYAVRFPRSFTAARMVDEFGPGTGAAWLWKAARPTRSPADDRAARPTRALRRGSSTRGRAAMLEGKTVVVTGVGAGLGSAVAAPGAARRRQRRPGRPHRRHAGRDRHRARSHG